MSVGPKIRFEVFKRDGFTCRYCGGTTPSVVLEVDHIIPVVEGGDDAQENLATSCFMCNRGKGRVLLDDNAPVEDIHERTILLLERERQLREYNEVRRSIRTREDNDVTDLLVFWYELVPEIGSNNPQPPQTPSLRRFLRELSVEDIKDAMEIAVNKVGVWKAAKYTYGILHNQAKDKREAVA